MRAHERVNTGPILIFLHGFPNNMTLWRRQLEHFENQAHTVCFDMEAESQLNVLTATVVDKIKQLKAAYPDKDVFLVGHDLGCFVLNEAALTVPHLIAAQILLNGAGLAQFSSRVTSVRQWLRSFYVPILSLPMVPRLLHGIATRIFDKKYFNFAPVGLYRQLSRRALAILTIIKKQDRCRVPTRLVSSKADPFLIEPSDRELERFFEQATVQRIPGGHWSPISEASLVNTIIADSLMQLETVV